ncbi:Glutathione S-transferase, N-terminal domain containing protein [Seminavis robusta]|uniref:Glutathione S-transferase, N-terminal domain containing protein n=1 Tax=Seminavis robusta TaxID=568900 RepID=A0A9N8F3E5_9STRA|nr:Glutathione S-transferase, N-terminal domain containing protein [Seminavis robusta]|eukprot:Sro2615_g332680.1 Glutathione S-transferase, N-terminal domain containing protein (336) ;mRNA; r:4376-5507
MRLFIVLLSLLAPRGGHGLSSNGLKTFKSSVSRLQKQITKKPKAPEPPLLERIGLESNTEPKTFQFLFQQIPDLLTASFPLLFRLGTGMFSDGYSISLGPRDDKRYTVLALGNSQIREISTTIKYSKQNLPIMLYEFEGCPFCRKVREAVSMLSLEVTFLPCPNGETNFRQNLTTTTPFLVDPNTGVQMAESDDIINYLYRVYGSTKSKIPKTLNPDNPLVPLSAALGLLPRIARGTTYRASNVPETPLVVWLYEGSPFCKIVRERLVELGLPHTQISCPRGSYNRDRLFDQTGGKFQVPYLEDPNTDVKLFESAAIIEYLEKVYGLPEPNVKYL